MSQQRRDTPVDRAEFLRRTGALGIAGAAALGFPLLETRPVDARPLPPAKDVIAAGGGATVKLGHVDGFSGVYASASESQQSGIQLAVDDAMKKNNRIKYEIIKGDDASNPSTGNNEAKRLVNQEKVDVLLGCLSSAVGLAVSATAEELGVPFIAIGTHDTNITGPKANKVTFRATCSNAMLANALGPQMLKLGKKWYFLVADYAFGTDAHDRLKKILLAASGGQEAGVALHKLGQTDYSSYMPAIRNSGADVLVFCNYGPDTQNSSKAAVQFGLNKTMKFGGILCGNEVAVGMPADDMVGSVWGYVWGPEVAGGKSQELYRRLKAVAKGYPQNWRQYLGYISAQQMIDRINAAGTTETSAVIKAFEGHSFDGYKAKASEWRACDHQNVQQTYAAAIVPKNKRTGPEEYFHVVNTVGGEFAAESCSNPDSAAATKIFASQTPKRQDYTPVSLKA